jgi:DNA polymerase
VDAHLQRRYLDAMGVQVWRLRDSADPSCEQGTSVADASSPAERPQDGVASMDWDRLHAAVRACRACALCETRTQTVFGVGNRDADLMIVGEAPGADEDRQGEPFVGRAGQLLNRMLAAVGLDRTQVYIANILKCRPPGNRDPEPEEAAACRAFLMRQIALVRPRVLLSVGRISAQNLLETGEAVGRLRGRWHELGPERSPLRVTYHPSYLLRSPDQKAKSWQDLTEVLRRLREDGGHEH